MLLDHQGGCSHAWEFVKTSIDVLLSSLTAYSSVLHKVHNSLHKTNKETTMRLVSHVLDQLILVMFDKSKWPTLKTINSQHQFWTLNLSMAMINLQMNSCKADLAISKESTFFSHCMHTSQTDDACLWGTKKSSKSIL
jgi:hypothetical protein